MWSSKKLPRVFHTSFSRYNCNRTHGPSFKHNPPQGRDSYGTFSPLSNAVSDWSASRPPPSESTKRQIKPSMVATRRTPRGKGRTAAADTGTR